jgi:hypothetical protein
MNVPSSSQYIFKRRSIWNMRNDMNNHMTSIIYLYYIITNGHEQYWITFIPSAWHKTKIQAWRTSEYKSAWTVRGTVHLFIGTGHNPVKITFMSLMTRDWSVFFSLSRCGPLSQGMSLCWSSLDHSFGMYLRVVFAYMPIFRRCFCLKDLRRRSRPPIVAPSWC